jgi:hypothetical protein
VSKKQRQHPVFCDFIFVAENWFLSPVSTFEVHSSNMPLSFAVTGADKDQLVVSLAAIILADSKLEVSAENINTVLSSSGNSAPAYYATLFSTYIEKAGGVEKFFTAPSAGGAGQ